MPNQYETCNKLLKANLLIQKYKGGSYYYYDNDDNLQFIYNPAKRIYFKDGNKMYNNEFKRFIRSYAARLIELQAFW